MLLPFAIAVGLLFSDSQPPIKVRLVVDEAKAALAILDKRRQAKPIEESDWANLFKTEGYRRLKDRELGMQRPFTEEDFTKFMLSDDLLARQAKLEETLARWQKVDVVKCASLSLAYLPKHVQLKASVFFLIKPKPNSFVWDVQKDPAVMIYLDPETSAPDLALTIAHEFHHVGYAGYCPSPEFQKWRDAQPEPRKAALVWQAALGEGYAVLAAAGGPGPNPLAPSSKQVREAWDDGVAHLPENMEKLQRFLIDVADGTFDAKKALEQGRVFYGTVGPWYTVGYHVAVTIENTFGRQKLIECYLDPRQMFLSYNEAARRINQKAGKLFLWSPELLSKLGIQG